MSFPAPSTTCSICKATGRGDARSMKIVPESVHKHVAGRSIVVEQWHAVIEACPGAVMVLVIVAVLRTVIISVEVGDRAVTVVV